MKLNITISNITFEIQSDEPYEIDEEIKDYCTNEDNPNKKYIKISQVETFAAMDCYIVHQIDQRVLIMKNKDNDLEYRLFINYLTGRPYALYKEIDQTHIEVEFLRSEREKLVINEEFLETIAVEKYLLAQKSIILHSSSILYRGKAILFTAPSGTGKSTQARLWNQYRNTEIINGDRNILHRNKDGTWNVRGIPFCGTSGIHKNVDVPLEAIVRLEQGKTDQIKDRTEMEIFKELYQESTVNVWDSKAIEQVMDMCGKLSKETKQIKLSCTMHETAVECLESFIMKDQEKDHV